MAKHESTLNAPRPWAGSCTPRNERRSSDLSWLQSQGVECVEGDLNDRASLDQACRGVQTVYHAAARVGDWGPWEEFVEITVNGTRNLAEAAATGVVSLAGVLLSGTD